MKLFLKLFILVLVLDLAIGFSMSYWIQYATSPNSVILIIDEIISFPINLWNRAFPEAGIYRGSSSAFWSVIFLNTFCQALVLFGLVKLLKKMF